MDQPETQQPETQQKEELQNKETCQKFLEYLCSNKITVIIYLLNGVRIMGEIDSFDQEAIILNSWHNPESHNPGFEAAHTEAVPQSRKRIIYNHVISTILPQQEES